MKKKAIPLLLYLFFGHSAFAQEVQFVNSGEIEFEKNSNMFAIVKRNLGNSLSDARALEDYKKTNPQFKRSTSTLTFGNNKTLFKATITTPPPPLDAFYSPITEQANITYIDFDQKRLTSQRQIFETTFLIQDTIKKIKWKITDETREIAGYQCRRANGIILDSIYVVAFYSLQIPEQGGPESFNGLPGMILSVTLPHENISWIATKITLSNNIQISPPVNGLPVKRRELRLKLEGAINRVGRLAQSFYKAVEI